MSNNRWTDGARDRAALYCRLSREDAEKHGDASESIQNQKAMLVDYAGNKGWEIHGVYCDEDYSGADTARPAFNRLIAEAREGRFNIVLCKTQSRFTRDMELVEKYIHGLFPLWGIRFIAIVDNADTNIRGNKKARQINGLVSQWYLEDLSENIRAVFDMKRRGGQYIGSFPVYGYRKAPENHNRLLVDEEAAETVREIYRMCLAGLGRQRIAALLNQRGIPNPTLYKQRQGLAYINGGQRDDRYLWNRTSVGRILKNPIYTGDMVQGIRKKASYKSKKLLTVPPEQWIVVPDTHEAIVDRDTFETVRRMLKNRTRSDGNGAVHPLAGKVRCMDCGSVMLKYSNTYQGKRRSYLRCKLCVHHLCAAHAIRLDLLETQVGALLKEYLSLCDAAELARRIHTAPKKEETAKKELARVQSEIAKRERAAQALYLDKVEGLISPEQFSRLNSAYLEETKALEQRRKALEQRAAPAEPPDGAARRLLDFDTLPRALAALMVKSVEIGERDPKTGHQAIRIAWNF